MSLSSRNDARGCLIVAYRRDVSFNMLQSRGPIRSDVAPGERRLHGWKGYRRGGGGAERLRLGVHHILPISLRFQTTGPGEMTVGAANCEINWTCDPRGRDQHPARGGECASALTLAHDKGTAKSRGSDRIRGQFTGQDVCGHGWASLDLCDIAAECVRRVVLLLALGSGAFFWWGMGFIHRSIRSTWRWVCRS